MLYQRTHFVLRRSVAIFALLLGVGCAPQSYPAKRIATSDRLSAGAVASIHPLATDAAMTTLKRGGNAVDAAVAAMLTLGVVDGHNSGIGGGCFILIRTAKGKTICIDARETAPALASRDMYIVNGQADTTLSQVGPLAVATPGALAGYEEAIAAAGTMRLADLLLPAADLAERGFRIDANYANKLKREQQNLAKFDSSAALLLPGGKPLDQGDTLVQRDLAATYRAIAREGTAYFYRGDFSRVLDDYMRQSGGLLRSSDLAAYKVTRREPIVIRYRGYEVVGMPPPSSGGLHVAQILLMLERFDLRSMSDADRITTIANAMSLAFADRAHWLGDPAYTGVPATLLDPTYLDARSQLISSGQAVEGIGYGTPPVGLNFNHDADSRHTTHVSVADREGNVCSITATINTSFGSKIILPGTGVFLNNEMDDFAIAPGTPNAFGLVGNEANAVAAGKRPLSSMSPTIVLKDGTPFVVIGSAGGPRIITQVACVLINLLDLGLDPAGAMTTPRIHHQWNPNRLSIEDTFLVANPRLGQTLESRGFTLDIKPPVGATNLVVLRRSADGGYSATAVSEPRSHGKAAAK